MTNEQIQTILDALYEDVVIEKTPIMYEFLLKSNCINFEGFYDDTLDKANQLIKNLNAFLDLVTQGEFLTSRGFGKKISTDLTLIQDNIFIYLQKYVWCKMLNTETVKNFVVELDETLKPLLEKNEKEIKEIEDKIDELKALQELNVSDIVTLENEIAKIFANSQKKMSLVFNELKPTFLELALKITDSPFGAVAVSTVTTATDIFFAEILSQSFEDSIYNFLEFIIDDSSKIYIDYIELNKPK